MRNCSSFHLHRLHIGKVFADGGNGLTAVNELITTNNQPAPYCGIRKRCSRPLGGSYQSMVGSKRRRQLRHLADCISEGGNVHIVMRGFAADDHIPHFQTLPQTARTAGVDDAVGREFEDGRGSGRGGIDFAYSA